MRETLRIYILQNDNSKTENTGNSEASFLEFSVITENKKFKTQLYDKRDAVPSPAVYMPHLDSNIPSNI